MSKKVLVLGCTGSGKSSLINYIFKSDVAYTSDRADCATRTLDEYVGNIGAFHVSIVDTPGMARTLINIARSGYSTYDLILHVVRSGRISSSDQLYNDLVKNICKDVPRVVVLNSTSEKWSQNNSAFVLSATHANSIVGPYNLRDCTNADDGLLTDIENLLEIATIPKSLTGDLLTLGEEIYIEHVRTGKYLSNKRRWFCGSRVCLSNTRRPFTLKDIGYLTSAIVCLDRNVVILNNDGKALCTTEKHLSYAEYQPGQGAWTIKPKNGDNNIHFSESVYIKSEKEGYLSVNKDGDVTMRAEPDEWIIILEGMIIVDLYTKYDAAKQ